MLPDLCLVKSSDGSFVTSICRKRKKSIMGCGNGQKIALAARRSRSGKTFRQWEMESLIPPRAENSREGYSLSTWKESVLIVSDASPGVLPLRMTR